VTRRPITKRARRPGPITANHRTVFLQLLGEGAVVREAAEATGHSRQRFYELRKTDPEFAEQWDAAYESGTDVIEQEAIRRSVEGYDEVTSDGDGKVLRVVRRYSDSLLQTLLRGRRYNEQRVELSGPAGQPLVVEHRLQLTLRDGLAQIEERRRRLALEQGRPLSPEFALPRLAELEAWPTLEAAPTKETGNGDG
jgi:hypothetical protein